MDNLRNLWAFAAVARAGSFTLAAETLGVSTVALSRSVARLEKSLQVKLFTRTTRQVHLTDEGGKLFERVNVPFATIGEAISGVRQARGRPSGLVRVSSVTSYGRRHIIPILSDFFAAYPEIDVVLDLHDGASGRSRQQYDIRINWGERPELDKVAHVLTTLRLAAVASPAYLARRGSPTSPQHLSRHACITAGFDGGVRGRWIFTARGSAREPLPGPAPEPIVVDPVGPVVITGELEAVVDAAVAGLGIAVVSCDDAAEALERGAIIPILSGYDIVARGHSYSQVILQHPLRNLMAPGISALVDFLLERLVDRRSTDAEIIPTPTAD